MTETTEEQIAEDNGWPVTEAGAESAPAVEKKEYRPEDLLAAIEALLLATGEPLPVKTMASLLKAPKNIVEAALAALKSSYEAPHHGLDIVEIAGGWQFGTKPDHAALIEKMLREVRKVRLSPAALETLAIIAYRQPVTRAEAEAIRGVNIDGVMKTLLDRELIRITGKKEEVGRPLLYGTTDAFLMHFGLKSLADLPPLSEFDEIAKAKADVMIEEQGPDWHAISESQRDALDALTEAAERELSDLDAKLATLKPPKVKIETSN
ncbi:MAG: SMC-Scp complex subunit ScpB [Candidatus Hydrogenedentota bacterium]